MEDLEDLEWDLEYDEIRYYRHLATKKMGQLKPINDRQQPAPTSSWYGWITGKDTKETKDWDQQLKNLYDQFEFEDYNVDQKNYPADYVKYKFASNLQKGSITLRNYKNLKMDDLVSSEYDFLRIEYLAYPNGYLASFKIQDLKVINPSDNNFATLVESKSPVNQDSNDFFVLEYASNPPSGIADHSLILRMLPLKIFVNPAIFGKVMAKFAISGQSTKTISKLQDAARDVYEGMKSTTKAGLIFAIEEHRTLFLDVEASAPVFIIPSSSKIAGSPFLVLDAGHLKLNSKLVNKKHTDGTSESLFEKTVSELRGDVYDSFVFNLNSASVYITEDLNLNDKGDINNFVVENVNMDIILDACIIMNATEFTKFKLSADLARLHLNVSERHILTIQNVLNFMLDSFKLNTVGSSNESIAEISGFPFIEKKDTLENLLDDNDPQIFKSIVESSSDSQKILQTEIRINVLSALVSENQRELALVEATDISMSGFLKASESNISAVLQLFEIKNMFQPVGEYPYLIKSKTTTSNDPLLKFTSESFGANSNTKSQSTLTLQSVEIFLVQECIIHLMPILNAIGANDHQLENEIHLDKFPSQRKSNNLMSQKFFVTKGIQLHLVEKNQVIGFMSLDSLNLAFKANLANSTWTGTTGQLAIYDGPTSKNEVVLQIREDKSVDFKFETLNLGQTKYPGFDSYFSLHSASWKILYDHRFVSRVKQFFGKLQVFKTFVDSASKAAQESSKQMQETAGKLYFEVFLETPIITIPTGSNTSNDQDMLILYPGSVSASTSTNEFGYFVKSQILLKINAMKLESVSKNNEGESFRFMMVQDIDLNIQLDSMKEFKNMPNSVMDINVSDINIKVTNHQYRFFALIIESMTQSEQDVNLKVIEKNVPIEKSHSEYLINLSSVNFEAFITPTKFDEPKMYSLAQFVGTNGIAKLRLKDGEPLKFELKFQGLSILDTRKSKNTMFRDILLPLQDVHEQFLLKYEQFENQKEYNVSIDRPKVILEIDHLRAIQAFAVSAWVNENEDLQPDIEQKTLKGIVNFVDPEIVLVADPDNSSTEAVILKSEQFVITQNVVIALSFKTLGTFFCRMDQRNESQYRFLDNCDLSFSLDDRIRPDGIHIYSANLETSTLIFRIAYRDVLLLKELSNRIVAGTSSKTALDRPELKPSGKILLKQNFTVSVEGLKAVLIDDLNDLHMPIFECGCTKTVFELNDWSSKYRVELGISLFANYFNVKNSHWEPLIESWQFSVDVQVIN